MPIRANWLISNSRRDYEIILSQAFIFLFAEKDYEFSVKSKFPVKVQQKLRETMNQIKGPEYKDQVGNSLKSKWRAHADLSTFHKEVD